MLRLVFETETVELLLPNAPGRCRARGAQFSFFFFSKSSLKIRRTTVFGMPTAAAVNPLKPELNPICYLLALLGAHHFLHVSRIRVKLLAFRLLMSYIYGAPILDVSRSHTTTQHSR